MYSRSERGQALIIIVLGIVGLLAFAGLAIDGGRLLSERRHAQNAVDNSSLAAAKALCSDENPADAALYWADQNGYDNNGTSNTVTVTNPPTTGSHAGDASYVHVRIDTEIPAMLIQFVYSGPLAVSVAAESECKVTTVVSGGQPPMPGFAIVTLGNCLASGGSLLEVTGGGNSGGIRTWDGDIFINTPENPSNFCGIAPPSSRGNDGIGTMSPGNKIYSVGTYDYSGEPKIYPNPIELNYNGGVPVSDPLAGVPEPVCLKTCTKDDNSCKSGSDYYPGAWDAGDMGPGEYHPGIYCISGELKAAGSDQINGTGVLFFFVDNGTQFTGESGLNLSAPTTSNCSGDACDYVGMVMFSARGNTSEIDLGGNGINHLVGTVYLPNTHINAHGGGSQPDEALIWGQYIADHAYNNGNGTLDIWYRSDLIYVLPQTYYNINLIQ